MRYIELMKLTFKELIGGSTVRNLYISSCILGIVLFAFGVICAEEIQASEDNIDVYVFPVRPGMDEWKEYRTNAEQLAACQIPEDILSRMSTEGLVKTCLNYPKAFDFMAYSDFPSGINRVISGFNGLIELMKRSQAAPILLEEYIEADPDSMQSIVRLSGEETRYPRFRLMFIELLLGHEKMLIKFNKEEKKVLLKECILKYEKKQNHASFGLMHFKTIGMLIGRILLSEGDREFAKKYYENKAYKLFLEDKIQTDEHILNELMSSARRYLEENN